MTSFKGFPEGKVRLTPIPGLFFSQLLPEIDHLGELKTILYAFWRLDRMEGVFRCLRREDFTADEHFMQGLGAALEEAQAALDESLKRLVERGAFLVATVEGPEGQESYYMLNSPKGRAAVQAIEDRRWRPWDAEQAPAGLGLEQPNIFRLYEEHIGPLTPMLADALREAEAAYPDKWIQDAVRIAVENNKRNWRYIRAILDRWQTEGRDEPQDRRDTEKARRRYIEGEFSDHIEH